MEYESYQLFFVSGQQCTSILPSGTLKSMDSNLYYRKLFFKSNNDKWNFLPFGYLKKLFDTHGFDLVRNEKIIVFRFNFPLINNFLNTIFRLPILNFFCLINITVLKKKKILKKKIIKFFFKKILKKKKKKF